MTQALGPDTLRYMEKHGAAQETPKKLLTIYSLN